jgi:drug/metabolite transporter (DMT)-like permease
LHWLALTLACAFALASADALTKQALGGRGARELTLVRFTVPGVLLAPWLLAQPLPALPPAFWAWMAALMPAEILAMLFYQRAIRDHPLALTLPYLAFTPALVAVVGWLLLGETVSALGLLGILLIVFGGWLLNVRPGNGRGAWRQVVAPLLAIWQNPGSRQMLGVATVYAFTAVGSKRALAYASPETFGAMYFALLGLLTLLLFGVAQPARLRVVREQPIAVLGVGVLMAVMVTTHFMAIASVEAAYMIAVKRTSLLFGILYGALLFGERHLGRNLLAGALMVAGVAMIALQS